MTSVDNLVHSLAERGFTTSNFRKLKSIIGEQEFNRLAQCWKDLNCGKKPFGEDVYIATSDNFTRIYDNNGNLELNIKVNLANFDSYPYNPKKIIGKNINFEYIKQVLEQFRNSVASQFIGTLSKKTLQSKTIKILYSPKFRTQSGLNRDGYYMTTIISKKNGKPVNAFVKSIKITPEEEEWGIYVKRGKNYELVGRREFGVDDKRQAITSKWMDGQGHEEYAGIGLRAHQIAIERMLQKGFTNIEIQAEAQAFPFHYKAGFRVPEKMQELKEFTPDEFFDFCSAKTGLPVSLVKNYVHPVKKGDVYYINLKDIEALRKISFLQNNGKILDGETPMILERKQLNEWIKRIQAQPIFLGNSSVGC